MSKDKFSDQPSLFLLSGSNGIEGIKIHCGDETITIRPCGPRSESGPDGPYPYIEVEGSDGKKKTGFPLSSKRKFDTLFDDLWGLSQ